MRMSGQSVSRAAVAAGAVVVLGTVVAAAQIVRVVTLSRDGRLLVSFELTGGYTPIRRGVAAHRHVLVRSHGRFGDGSGPCPV